MTAKKKKMFAWVIFIICIIISSFLFHPETPKINRVLIVVIAGIGYTFIAKWGA